MTTCHCTALLSIEDDHLENALSAALVIFLCPRKDQL